MLSLQKCNRFRAKRLLNFTTTPTRHLASSSPWRKQYGPGYDRNTDYSREQDENAQAPKQARSREEWLASRGTRPPPQTNPTTNHDHDQDSSTPPSRSPKTRQEWLSSRGIRPPPQKSSLTKPKFEPLTSRAMKKHLQYLQDPVKLADAVKQCLSQEKLEEAQELVEAASRKALVTVSWNHVINYLLGKKRVNAAIKVFNDMKKRAQTPDAHTYTILFRGLADIQDASPHRQNLDKALSIYQSMLATNSPVKPNIIHTNAVMKVCGRAGDIDAMMGIAAQLQEKGLRAPNNLTYTTIFNAMRLHVQAEKDVEVAETLKRKTMDDARRIWFDVVVRWRKDMRIDEELVCSLGRLLLLGNAKDVDDIFSLVQQTMDVPRQHPVLGSKARSRMDPSLQGNKAALPQPEDEMRSGESSEAADTAASTQGEDGEEPEVVQRWDGKLQTSTAGEETTNTRGHLVKPGQNTLSLVAEALLQLRMKDSMVKYWNIFTKQLSVNPDSPNYHAYLRVLKTARASSETVQLVLAMPRRMVEYKTIRIAMSTCGRDKMNPSAFQNAGKILDLMQSCLSDTDIGVLHTYLEVCVGGRETIREACNNDDTRYAHGQRMLRGLTRLDPHLNSMKSILAFGSSPTVELSSRDQSNSEERRNGLLALMGEMVSAYDQLLNNAMVPRESYGDIMSRRSAVAAYITRNVDKRRRSQRPRTSGEITEQPFKSSQKRTPAYERNFRPRPQNGARRQSTNGVMQMERD